MISIVKLLVLLALLASAGCGSLAPPPRVNGAGSSEEPGEQRQSGAGKSYRFRWAKCEYGNLPVEIDCGYLTVPVDRTDPEAGRIRLAVTIIRARSGVTSETGPAPDPVVILAGQPGSAATLDVQPWLESPLLEKRDIILMDLRGTGKSQANLNCPELEDNNTDDPNAVKECRQRLEKAKYELEQYASAQSAADLNDLRLSLGYESWNVLGISYGTRVALTLLRDYPKGVRSVVLDSVYPLEVNVYEEQAINGAQAIQAYFDGCHQDAQCAYVYPDLEQVSSDLIAFLHKNPRQVTVADPRTGETEEVMLDGRRMAGLILEALNTPETLARIPYIIYETQYGNDHAIAGLMFPGSSGEAVQTAQQAKQERRAFVEGAYYSVLCSEEMGFNKRSTAETTVREANSPLAELLYAEAEIMFEHCEAWNIETANEIETQPVTSPTPALILSGLYDPLAPTKWARQAAQGFPDSNVLIFPGVGHTVLNLGDCPNRIVAEFFANPVELPDTTCITDIQVEYWLP